MQVIMGQRVAKILAILAIFQFSLLPLPSLADEAEDLIKKVEDNLNGITATMKITMIVKTKRAERTMKMESWAIGKDNAFSTSFSEPRQV